MKDETFLIRARWIDRERSCWLFN